MLENGERQVAPELSGIRRDHVARYRWAATQLAPASRVIDVACGVGYGAAMLADAGHAVLAIDNCAAAIAYAEAHYARPGIAYQQQDASHLLVGTGYDAAVCFETIEHLADPLPLLRELRRAAPVLLASVPNEAVFPHQGRIAFHHRHYTRAEFEALLVRAGYEVTACYGQLGPHSDVDLTAEGRTLVMAARRAEARVVALAAPRAPGPVEIDMASAAARERAVRAAKDTPEHVAIVGLGPSCAAFFELTRRLGGVSAYCDEVWGLNAIGDVLACDRIFHMDDVRVQEIRAAARPDSNIAAMLRWLKSHPGPVYTSLVRAGYPGMVSFPLEEVLNAGLDSNGAAPYFNSTAAYAIAFAVHIGVKKISLFGLDYTLANSHHAEKGRACCEFWLGVAAARGVAIAIPDSSSLMDACEPAGKRLYGYDCAEVRLVDQDDGAVKVAMTERPPPSAEEIERAYDHRAHPNPLMRAQA